MRFNDKIILLKDKVNNKFFDLHYFVAKENYDINDIDKYNYLQNNGVKNLMQHEFKSSYSNFEKLNSLEIFFTIYNEEMKKILKDHFNIGFSNHSRKRLLRKKATTVINPSIGSLFLKINNETTKTHKTASNNNLFNVTLEEKTEDEEKEKELTEIIKQFDSVNHNINRQPTNTRLKLNFDGLTNNGFNSSNNFDSVGSQVCNITYNSSKDPPTIDVKKLIEIENYIDFERKKIQLLFLFFDTFVNIRIKNEYRNILTNHEFNEKFKNNPNDNADNVNTCNNSNNMKNSELEKLNFKNDFNFFENLNSYRLNHSCVDKYLIYGIKDNINFNLSFDYRMLLLDDLKDQIVIFDLIILNILGVLKQNLTYKILEFLITKNKNKIPKNIIKKTTKFISRLNKGSSLGLLFCLIDKKIEYLDKKKLILDDSEHVFFNDSLIRKINKFIFYFNEIELKSQEFKNNFNPDITFDVRKISLFSYIKYLDNNLNIFDNIFVINQHMYDFILLNKIENEVIDHDHFGYRVFLEFRNFLFEYKDKKINSPDKKIFKSLADKQLIEHSSRNLGNKFYFLKQNQINNLNSTDNYNKITTSNINTEFNMAINLKTHTAFSNKIINPSGVIITSCEEKKIKHSVTDSTDRDVEINLTSRNNFFVEENKLFNCTSTNQEIEKKKFGFYDQNKNNNFINGGIYNKPNIFSNFNINPVNISKNYLPNIKNHSDKKIQSSQLLPFILKHDKIDNSFSRNITEENEILSKLKKNEKNLTKTLFSKNNLSNNIPPSIQLKKNVYSILNSNNLSDNCLNNYIERNNLNIITKEPLKDITNNLNIPITLTDRDNSIKKKTDFFKILQVKKNLINDESKSSNIVNQNISKRQGLIKIKNMKIFRNEKFLNDIDKNNQRILTHSLDKINFNFDKKQKIYINSPKRNGNKSNTDDSKEGNILPFNQFADKLYDIKTARNAISKPHVIDINENDFVNNPHTSSNNFYGKKMLIINRNKFKNFKQIHNTDNNSKDVNKNLNKKEKNKK